MYFSSPMVLHQSIYNNNDNKIMLTCQNTKLIRLFIHRFDVPLPNLKQTSLSLWTNYAYSILPRVAYNLEYENLEKLCLECVFTSKK